MRFRRAAGARIPFRTRRLRPDPGRGRIRAWETANHSESSLLRYFLRFFMRLAAPGRAVRKPPALGASLARRGSLGNIRLFSEVFSSGKPIPTDEQSTPSRLPERAVRIRVRPGHDKNGENFWDWRLTCKGQFLQFARTAIVGYGSALRIAGSMARDRQHGRRPKLWRWRVSEANTVPNSRRVGGIETYATWWRVADRRRSRDDPFVFAVSV